MNQSTLKGLVHLGLALTALYEVKTATTGARKLLLGSMFGFHAHATLYHFAYEKGSDESSIRDVDPKK